MDYLYAGSWPDENGNAGICAYSVNKDGSLTLIEKYCENVSAGFICISNSKKFLYVVDETKMWRDFILDQRYFGGRILVFQINQDNGKLTYVNELPSCGCNPNYLSIDPTDKWLCAVNYGTDFGRNQLSLRSEKDEFGNYHLTAVPDETNIVLIELGNNGQLLKITDLYKFQGKPVHYWKLFQWCPHAHAAKFSPDGKYLVAADRGSDKIYLFKVNYEEKGLELKKEYLCNMRFGPRNILFHPEKNKLYVLGETVASLACFEYEPENSFIGNERYLRTVECPLGLNNKPETFEEFLEIPMPADIALRPQKDFIFTTTRNSDVITAFRIREDGMLDRTGIFPSEGEWPMSCCIDISGRYLFAANMKSGTIKSFRIENGCLNTLNCEKRQNRVVSCRIVSL